MKEIKKVSTSFVKSQFNSVGLTLILYILFVLFLPLALWYYLEGVNLKAVNIINRETNVLLMVGSLYLIVVIGTLIPFIILMFKDKIKLKDIWRKTHLTLMDFISSSIKCVFICTFILYLALVLSNYFHIGEIALVPIGLPQDRSLMDNLIYFILYVIAVPFVEEFAFRGVLLRVLGRYGNFFAMVTISLFYSLMHPNFVQFIVGFFLSIYLIKITLYYKSIQPAIAIHMIFNLILYALEMVPVEYAYLNMIVIAVIYLLAIVLFFLKQFHTIRVKRNKKTSKVAKVFFTRPTVIISLILLIIYEILIFNL